MGERPPPLAPTTLEPLEVLAWWRRGDEPPVRVRCIPQRSERRRHSRKYAEGNLGPERSFHFRGPDDKLNLRAQNLNLFLQIADGVDDETWMHHLRQGDYSEWFRSKIKDAELAGEAERVEKRADLAPKDSRAAIREAVERRYTLPSEPAEYARAEGGHGEPQGPGDPQRRHSCRLAGTPFDSVRGCGYTRYGAVAWSSRPTPARSHPASPAWPGIDSVLGRDAMSGPDRPAWDRRPPRRDPSVPEARTAMTNRARRRFGTGLAAAGTLVVFWAAAASAAEPPRLELKKGDRIIIIGNTLAERMQYYGHFETLLHSRFPELELVVHNLGWSADELTLRPAPGPLQRPRPHAQGREARRPHRRLRLQRVVRRARRADEVQERPREVHQGRRRPPSTTARTPPRLVLLSPIAQEDLKNPHITDGKKNNENIKLYTDAMAELARQARRRLRRPVHADQASSTSRAEQPLTINGIHLSDDGYRRLGADARRGPLRPAAGRRSRPT